MPHLQRARILADLGRGQEGSAALDSAERDLSSALAFEPSLAVAHYNRALLHEHRGHRARAAMRLRTATEAKRSAHDDAARALELAGADHPWHGRFAALVQRLAEG